MEDERGAAVTDLEPGEHQRLSSDFRMQDYSFSPDSKRVVFTAIDELVQNSQSQVLALGRAAGVV